MNQPELNPDAALTVLVVDNHAVVRRGVVSVIQARFPSATIIEAENQADALRLAESEQPDLLLLDVDLGDGSGSEVLDRVVALGYPTRTVMLTVFQELRIAQSCLQKGASGYVSKDSAAEHLEEAIESALAGEVFLSPDLRRDMQAAFAGQVVQAPHEQLSKREFDVFRLVAQANTAKEISRQLGISEKTIATYRARIAEKTGLKTAAEIIRYSVKAGLD